VDKALTVRDQNTAVGQTMPGLEGFEGIDLVRDLKVPVIKIVHGTSKMEGAGKHGGDFYNTISGEFAERLQVVPLVVGKARAKFNKDEDKPDCRSNDCITGTTYGACAHCQFNANIHQELWQKDERGDRPAHCDEGFRFLLYLPDEMSYGIFNASKTNVNPAKLLITRLIQGGKKAVGVMAPYGALWEFATAQMSAPGKQWYQLAPKFVRWNSPEEIAEYRALAAKMQATGYEEAEDAGDYVDAEVVDPDAPVYAGESYQAPPPAPKGELF
jgi:hypothetical protein